MVHTLHDSFVRILRMIRSIETTDQLVTSSWKAVNEARALLARVKD
jgi:hypothetical protein